MVVLRFAADIVPSLPWFLPREGECKIWPSFVVVLYFLHSAAKTLKMHKYTLRRCQFPWHRNVKLTVIFVQLTAIHARYGVARKQLIDEIGVRRVGSCGSWDGTNNVQHGMQRHLQQRTSYTSRRVIVRSRESTAVIPPALTMCRRLCRWQTARL